MLPSPQPMLDALHRAGPLDGPAKALGSAVRALVKPGPTKDALSGSWLGHPLHPLLTDVVIGSLVSVSLVDLLSPGSERAARRLLYVGLAAALPTAISGASDWADSERVEEEVRRAGFAHAAANWGSLALYAASLRSRRRGSERGGRLLALLGASGLGLSGYLGAHLSYAKGVGVHQTTFDEGPAEWTPVGEAVELALGSPRRVVAAETPILLLRHSDGVHAIHDRCSHRGCSLSDGELDGHVITCPCHGSQFDLRSGALLRGPATAGQPAFDVREAGQRLELRLRRGPGPEAR